MSVLVARHGLSEANNRNNLGTLLFGHPDATLMDEGRADAREMGNVLRQVHGIDPNRTKVAVSRMRRSQETAREAGFVDLVLYGQLNEVDTGQEHEALKRSILERQHSTVALRAAELILEDPPRERVWVSHGLVIAGLCEILGIANEFEKFVPRFCEIRELPIDIPGMGAGMAPAANDSYAEAELLERAVLEQTLNGQPIG